MGRRRRGRDTTKVKATAEGGRCGGADAGGRGGGGVGVGGGDDVIVVRSYVLRWW